MQRSLTESPVSDLQHTSETATMALVSGYSSDEDDAMSEQNGPSTSTAHTVSTQPVQAAPEVSLEVHSRIRTS